MSIIRFEKDYPTLASKKCFLKLLLLEHGLSYQRILQGKEYAEVAAWIYNTVPKLQDKCYNTATRINWILTDRTDFPVCRNCGHQFGIGRVVNAKEGYGKFCSRTCSSTSEETKANIDAAFIEHYGTRRIYSNKKKEEKEKPNKKTKIVKEAKPHEEKTITVKETVKEEQQNLIVFSSKDLLSCFENFKTLNFPFPSSTSNEINHEIEKLKFQTQYNDKLYSPIIRQYCPSIWKCQSHGTMSPYDYWNYLKSNFDAFKRLYDNRMKYRGKVTPDILREGMNIAKFAGKVTYLKPFLAKRLIKTYLPNATEIFNPFNGFSGIMLGATLGCNKHYIGQDLNSDFVAEANNMIKDFLLDAEVKVQDIFTDQEKEYEALFCCPPYEDIEQWNYDSEGKCIDKNLTCDEWIDVVLSKYRCKQYLFVVDKTEKYKDKIVEVLGNESHLNENCELVLWF